MSYMLYTGPGRGQSKVARAQDLRGKAQLTAVNQWAVGLRIRQLRVGTLPQIYKKVSPKHSAGHYNKNTCK